MKEKTSTRWDKRYKRGWHEQRSPTEILKRYLKKPKKGKAMEIACGTGQNSILLTKNGFDVDAIDLSQKALEIANKKSKKNNLDVNWIKYDFNKYKLPNKYYNLITSSNFYIKKDFKKIHKSLRKNGYFIYHHHLDLENQGIDQIKNGPPKKYRFKPKEIKKSLKNFEIKQYEENIDLDNNEKAVFDLVAKKKQCL